MITMGTVMEIDRSRALVFTMDGSVTYIKPRLGLFVGQQISFAKKETLAGKRRLLAVLPYAAVAAAVLAVAIVAAGFLGGFGLLPAHSQPCAAFIALDINPSIQFKIDGEGKVLSVEAINADGKTLLSDLKLVGKPVQAAVSEAIARAKALGFIEDSKNVVLVAGTLNAANGDVSGQRSQYKDKLQAILGGMEGGGDADVLALYIEDPSVKAKADSNGLSIGRELLKEFAEQYNIALDDSDIRSGRISDLLDKLSSPNCLPVVTPQPSEPPEDTVEPTDPGTAEPTDTPTAPPDTHTSYPTDKPTDHPASGVSVKVMSDGLHISWPKAGAGDGDFQYYKIVFSVGNSAPKYPDDGYAKCITDIGATSTTVKPNSSYSGGDLDGSVKPGMTYYISVTYVYQNGCIYGNTVRAKCPDIPANTAAPSFSGSLSCSKGDDSLHLSWTKGPREDGFCYYKVVASESVSHPKYPGDGYIVCISDYGDTSCDVSACDGLDPGSTYYIGITYVYNDGDDNYYYYTSVAHVTMPGTPEDTCTPDPACTDDPCTPEPDPTDTPVPAFSGPSMHASFNGTTLHVSWAKVPDSTVSCGGKVYSNFQFYKVVVATHANPKYPADGYIACEDMGTGSGSYDIGGDYAPGSVLYVAVTYVFDNGKLYTSDYCFTIPSPTPDPTPTPTDTGA